MMKETVQDVLKEMRERRVSHGKAVSPTLIGWADRIEAAMGGFRLVGEIVSSPEGSLCIEFYDGKPIAPMKLYALTAQQAKGE